MLSGPWDSATDLLILQKWESEGLLKVEQGNNQY